jgi:hypothetical protein
MQRALPVVCALLLLAGCARQPPGFDEQHARAHVTMLASTIGSRPVGSDANARARAYIVDQLRRFGFDVRVQETDARRAELGRTARVSNIIAVRQGSRDEAVGLLAHYDSAPESPGGGDDGFGVAVSLEAARVLAARTDRNWTLMVLLTDGEEAGLMGAAALVTDREVMERLHTYLNIEAAGSAGDAMLFETGPANGWLVNAWARHAPHPRGDSFGIEIYRRLPNDTDFSILKVRDIPGLNFAIIGDSYAYHSARDTADRLSGQSLRETGENVVAIVTTLDGMDITQRSAAVPTYFDVMKRSAVMYGPAVDWVVALLALVLGVAAWVRVSSEAVRMAGIGRWLLTLVWTAIGVALVIAVMVAATWALRAVREVYHPWYARPDRLFLMLIAVGSAMGWSISRVGRWLPARAHGLRHPLTTWSAALPVWILCASGALWAAPGAAYLWTIPLVVAGLLLAAIPPRRSASVRIVSLLILLVTSVFWIVDTRDLLRFMVTVFGRLPLITPATVYAAILAVAGVMIVPPIVAAVAARRPLLRPSLMTAVLLLAIAFTAGWAYVAPAYTSDQPLRRYVRAIQMPSKDGAVWEVASIEPGLDLAENAPGGWSLARPTVPEDLPWGPLPHPFVFRTNGPSLGAAPMSITEYSVRPLPAGIELSLTVVPQERSLDVTFLLPRGIAPARSNLPGIVRRGRWAATYAAVPAEGVTLRASFSAATPDALKQTEVLVTSDRFPGGAGWQRLPEWLPQQHAVWTATAAWLLALPPWAGVAPVPPLR